MRGGNKLISIKCWNSVGSLRYRELETRLEKDLDRAGMVAHSRNSSSRETEAGGAGVQGQTELNGKT